jgi:hypothetical protein
MLRLAHSSHLKLVASEVRARPAFPPVGVASPFDRTLPTGFVLERAPEKQLSVVGERAALPASWLDAGWWDGEALASAQHASELPDGGAGQQAEGRGGERQDLCRNGANAAGSTHSGGSIPRAACASVSPPATQPRCPLVVLDGGRSLSKVVQLPRKGAAYEGRSA